MNDSEARGLILRQLYNVRHETHLIGVPDELKLPSEIGLNMAGNIVAQLKEQHLIEFTELMGMPHRFGRARINAFGVDVVEGTRKAAIAITLDQSINVHGSSHVQIGKGNIQNATIEKLALAIDQAEATQEEKAKAKSLWEQVSNNKLLLALLYHFGFG